MRELRALQLRDSCRKPRAHRFGASRTTSTGSVLCEQNRTKNSVFFRFFSNTNAGERANQSGDVCRSSGFGSLRISRTAPLVSFCFVSRAVHRNHRGHDGERLSTTRPPSRLFDRSPARGARPPVAGPPTRRGTRQESPQRQPRPYHPSRWRDEWDAGASCSCGQSRSDHRAASRRSQMVSRTVTRA
jgi:hypothetical protein